MTNAGPKIRAVLAAVIAAVGVLMVGAATALAQCALCKNAVTGSPEAAKLAGSLNFAIIILLIPPVLIFCGIFYLVFYRQRKQRETIETSDGATRRLSWREKLSPGRKRRGGKRKETGGALA